MNKLCSLIAIFCYLTNLNSQNNTTQDFNVPSTTVMYANGTFKYNGETKQLTPTEQNQYEFKNGLLIKESSATIIASLKIANQKNYTYNTNNELIKITKSSGILNSGASHEDLSISYLKSDQKLSIYKNGQPYISKFFDAKGNLIQEDVYDALSDYIFKKITFKNNAKTTKQYNKKQEPINKTTEYLNKDNNLIMKVNYGSGNPYSYLVTTYNYDANGNLTSSTDTSYKANILNNNFEFFKDGNIVDVPAEARFGAPETTTFYNYSENKLWTAQISSKQLDNKEIEIKVRAIQTNDGQTFNTNNQAAFMAYLNTTYQKINAQKP